MDSNFVESIISSGNRHSTSRDVSERSPLFDPSLLCRAEGGVVRELEASVARCGTVMAGTLSVYLAIVVA